MMGCMPRLQMSAHRDKLASCPVKHVIMHVPVYNPGSSTLLSQPTLLGLSQHIAAMFLRQLRHYPVVVKHVSPFTELPRTSDPLTPLR
jgi:hypothetical protein